MKMLRHIFVFLLVVCYIRGQGQDSKCDCSSTCKPKITVTSSGKPDRKPPPPPTCPPKGKDTVEAEDLPFWYCPNGIIPGAPCYHFVYPKVNVTSMTWKVADAYCKALGGFSNLLWIASPAEFKMIRHWLMPQIIVMPPGSITVWVGAIRSKYDDPAYYYYWTYVGGNVDDDYWQPGAPQNGFLKCVGMDPYVDMYLGDYNCDSNTGNITTRAGLVCKRQVISPPTPVPTPP